MDRLLAMQIFVEVVEEGSFTKAAETLGVNRTLATRYVSDLEAWQGARLLQRSTRSLSLTSAGEAFLQHCRPIVEQVRRLDRGQSPTDQEPQGRLRIATSPSYAKHCLTKIIAAYLEQNPKVQIEVLTGDKKTDLIREQVDLAIRVTNDLDPSFFAKKIGVCHSVVCASPKYLKKIGGLKKLEDLSNVNCLTYSHYGKSEWRFRKDRQERTIPVQGNFHSNDLPILIEAALEGVGLIHVPTYTVESLLKSRKLVAVCSEWQPYELGIYCVYLSKKHLPMTMRSFIDFLSTSLSE